MEKKKRLLTESEKSRIEAGATDKFINEYRESVKLHAESIKKWIDVEHSVSIYHPESSFRSSFHIIELKTDDPEKERTCFCYSELNVNPLTELVDPYIIAARSPDIWPNIPQWKDELEAMSYYSGGPGIRSGSWSYAKQCQKMACPETGAFTAYKEVFCNDHESYICELLIPEDALRSSGFDRKCRADKAIVIAIWALDYVDADKVLHFVKTRRRVAHSFYDKNFVYRVGETVTPTNGFDMDRFNTCAPGIHFYMTMAEAARN